MSTTSQRMGLKIPDGSDPFLRTDFVQNLNTLDKYPGPWICTSSTRPTWGAGQAGMSIMETDTRNSLMWTGTTWREMLHGPAIWWGSLRPVQMIGKGTQVNYTVGTFTVNRAGALFAMLTTEYSMPNGGRIAANFRCLIDGAESNLDVTTGYWGEYAETDFPLTSTFGTSRYHVTTPQLGIRNISAGTHSVGLRVLTQATGSNVQMRLTSIRAAVIFVNATDR